MKIRFDVTAEELAIIQGVLSRHLSDDCKVWVFGSRAKNSARFNSDLDLAIECKAKLPQKSVSELKEDFDDSKLSFAVDVVDMNGIEAYFKKIIDAQKVVFPLKSKTPKLRFPEFGGEWEENMLEKLTKINQGLQIPISERYTEQVENSYFYITNEFLKEGAKKKYYIKNPPESVVCTENDILMTRTGNTGEVVTNVNGAFHNNFFKIKYSEELNKDFLVFFLKLPKTQNVILKMAGTSTIPDLNHGDFYKIKINFPQKQEQQKIADFLTVVDARIEALTKQQELTEQYKKGVMQKIFLQEIRFRADDGSEFSEWEYRELAEIAVKNTNKNSSNKISFVLTNSASKGIVSQQDYFDKDIANQNNLDGYYIVDINDFVYNPRISILAPVGPIKRNKLRQGIMSPLYTVFTCHIVNLDFIEKYFDTAMWHDYMFSIANYGARHDRMAISNGNFFKMPILFPSLAEQTKIANFLSSIDSKIEAIASELQATKKFKKALLQQMFV